MSTAAKDSEVVVNKMNDEGKISPGWLMVFAIAYFVCPLDFDFIPVLGWLDDVGFLSYAGYKLIKAK